MGDVIDLKQKIDPKVKELFDIGTAIDKMVIEGVEKGFDLFEISAIIAHRLGECIRNLPAKEHQADILIDVILKRSGLDNG